MAQTTKSSSRSKSSTGSRTKRTTSRNGSSATGRSTSRRTSSSKPRSSNGRGSTSRSPRKTSSKTSKSPVAKTGGKVVGLASKAKAPLLAGGAALAGVAGGLALKSRSQNRRPIKRLSSVSLPKVDLDSLTSAARQVRSIGEQVGDLADAADKTRKKHN
jgi:hypothetical protein